MPPWEQFFNDPQVKLDLLNAEWKKFMRDYLMKIEIFGKNRSTNSPNEIGFNSNPNIVMDARHQMIKNHDCKKIAIHSIPKESIKTDALKLLREEKVKKLSSQKEERMIMVEIERLKKAFENYEALKKNYVKEKVKCTTIPSSRMDKEFQIKSLNRFDSKSDFCKSEASQTDENFMLRIWCNGLDVNRKKEEILEELPSVESKGSIASHEQENDLNRFNLRQWNQSGCDGKNMIMKKFLESTIENQESIRIEKMETPERINFDGGTKKNEADSIAERSSEEKMKENVYCGSGRRRRSVEKAWNSWRNFTLKSSQRKREKLNCANKIESFLMRLEEMKKNRINAINSFPSNRLSVADNIARKFNHSSSECKRVKSLEKNEKKKEELNRIEREIRESQRESRQSLKPMEKREKVKGFKRETGSSLKPCPVPEFVSRMEKRREERIDRWNAIRERKRKAEAEKEKVRLEKEKETEEAEKLAAAKKREEMREKKKQEEERKEKLKFQMTLADDHHRKWLLLRGWKSWVGLMRTRRGQGLEAARFDRKRLVKGFLIDWKEKIEEIGKAKREMADRFHRNRSTRIFLKTWLEKCDERKKQFQAAADWNDFKITEKVFRKWLEVTKAEQLNYLTLKEKADSNFEKKLKREFLRKLRDYQKMRKIEVAMEKRKCLWRRKVQQILPDFLPAEASEISRH